MTNIATTCEHSDRPGATPDGPVELTVRIMTEIIGHEAIVPEAYKDSEGVWTWGPGITNASGHLVYPRYKDAPQTIGRCLEVFEWLLRTKYLPEVLAAFGDQPLTEAQLAAALSFHWNTGAIGRADWVKSWLDNDISQARHEFMNWRKPASIIERRGKERDLFFDGKWSGTGLTTVYAVRKPSYAPNWSSARSLNIQADLAALLTKGAAA